MFTWISSSLRRKRLAAIALATALAGCASGPDVAMQFGNFLAVAPEKVAVADSSVVIAGPQGYCVDSSATRDTATGAFVLLGSCASVANSARAAAPQIPGLLTASVSGQNGVAISDALDGLQNYFGSDAGRSALARDGDPSSIRVMRTLRRDGAFYLHARDNSAEGVPGLDAEYWRGLFDVHGRIVTVTVTGFKGRPMSNAAGLATLDAFAARIRLENATGATQTPEA